MFFTLVQSLHHTADWWYGDDNSLGNSGGSPKLVPNSSFPKQVFQVYLRVIFVREALVHFVICALHLAFDVSGMDDQGDELHTAVSLLHHVLHLTFLHKSCKFPLDKTFLWQQRYTQGTWSWQTSVKALCSKLSLIISSMSFTTWMHTWRMKEMYWKQQLAGLINLSRIIDKNIRKANKNYQLDQTRAKNTKF